jgi:signal transduction histidine kinase
VHFDDTLETVLSADLVSPFGMQSAWRQLVDLIGRRRVPPDARALAVLRRIRAEVPIPVRAASARGLEFTNPPPALVRLLALDELAVALPVLRTARLASAEWIQMLPDLSPPARSVLRNRRDLSPIVRRALETFGPVDFVLPDASRPVEAEIAEAETVLAESVAEEIAEPAAAEIESPIEPVIAEPVSEPVEENVVEEVAEVAPVEPAPVPNFIRPGIQIAFSRATPPLAPERILSPEQLVDWTEILGAPVAEHAPPPVEEIAESPAPVVAEPEPVIEEPVVAAPEPVMVEEEDFSFVALAGGVAALPAAMIFTPAQAQSGTSEAMANSEPVADAPQAAHEPPMGSVHTLGNAPGLEDKVLPENDNIGAEVPAEGPFEIAEVVARIDAYWRNREDGQGLGEAAAPREVVRADDFRFETDAKGMIRWVEGVSRAPIVGLSLDLQGPSAGASRVDGVAAGAFRRRAGFANARLQVDGESDAAGDWLISAIPVFDPANGRFTGYRGTARRPRTDERAEPVHAPASPTADSLRQLVHELRTPTNAIAGFAEMIETQMLGPVSDPYRDRASTIREQARELLGAIDDLDLAARIDTAALSLVPGHVSLRPLLSGIADDLAQLATLRGSWIALPIDDLAVTGDRRAVERLLTRLMATLVSASGPGERIGVRTALDGETVAIVIDRPATLSDYPGESVLGIDDEGSDATLLGTGFALRLARNLARELGGGLVIEPESLTLRLPASVNSQVGQAHLS